MFGNIVPCRGELKVKEYELYKAFYCGICRRMGREYLPVSRAFLSYDLVYMALVLQCANGDDISLKKGRCVCNPLKRVVFADCDSIGYTSAVGVLLIYHKLRDDVRDENVLWSTTARVLSALIRGGRRRAERAYPQQSECIKRAMLELDQLEKQAPREMDTVAVRFADMMSEIVAGGVRDEQNRRIAAQMASHTARWTYIADAFDDVCDDIKSGNYNPLIARCDYDGEQPDEFKRRIADMVNQTMEDSLAALAAAFELMSAPSTGSILRNIIYCGLYERQMKILFDKGETADGPV